MRKFGRILVYIIVCLTLAVSLAEQFGQFGAWIEVFGHLKLVWLVLLAICLGLSIVVRKRVLIFPTALVLILNATPVITLYAPEDPRLPASKTSIRIVQSNVWGGQNHDCKRALAVILAQKPDVIGFSEITPAWLPNLRKELVDYPYVIAEPQHGGIAVFSKIPMEGEVRYFGPIKRPRIVARLNCVESACLIFAHPMIPIGHSDMRNAEFALLAKEASAQLGPVILAGDLNCTPWSVYFGRLLSVGRLRDSEQGYGPQPSWNVFWPLPLFPIDHCLVNHHMLVLNRQLLSPIGSDHLPVLTDLDFVQSAHLGPAFQ